MQFVCVCVYMYREGNNADAGRPQDPHVARIPCQEAS
jgi:hypothetical protein